MNKIVGDLELASRAVTLALHRLRVDREDIYPFVARLAEERTGTRSPVIFWRKWGRTKGLQLSPSIGESAPVYAEMHITESAGQHVVLVQGYNPSVNDISDYLQYGVSEAQRVGVKSVGVITSQRFYTDQQLTDMAGSGMKWVMISDCLLDQQARMDELAPGLFAPFPHVRQQLFYRQVRFEPSPIRHPALA